MQVRIETLPEKKLIGKRMIMSLADNKTPALWREFMMRRREIKNIVGTLLYSVDEYNDPKYFTHFSAQKEFEKWAAVEVTDISVVPDGMETLTLKVGIYAVFVHKGPASTAPKTYQYIYGTWLPNSEFLLDSRPHLAIMGEKYKNDHPSSEEEIWIPIKAKTTISY